MGHAAAIGKPSSKIATAFVGAAIVASVVFLASLFGIFTRPIGSLAAIWPANALLLGVMVRVPGAARPAGWIAALIAYVAADLVAGSPLSITLWLSLANLSGAVTGYVLFRLAGPDVSRLRRPVAVLIMFAICVIASIAAAVAGGGAATIVFNRDFGDGLSFWFITELVNYVVILPAILTVPSIAAWFGATRQHRSLRLDGQQFLSTAALVASMAAAGLLGGPGSITFTVPALIWCALNHNVFMTALLTVLSSCWILIGIPAGIIDLPLPADPFAATISIRLAVALMALGPLTVASISRTRDDLIRQLAHAASHDPLTGILARSAFLERAEAALALDRRDSSDTSIVMLDIDHFKQVNDRHGHHCGDAVLKRFTKLIEGRLRKSDIFGRLGGEEFAVVLPSTTVGEALVVAENLRRVLLSGGTLIGDGDSIGAGDITITASMGISGSALAPAATIDELLATADRALYVAKRSGRNRVVVGTGAGDGTMAEATVSA